MDALIFRTPLLTPVRSGDECTWGTKLRCSDKSVTERSYMALIIFFSVAFVVYIAVCLRRTARANYARHRAPMLRLQVRSKPACPRIRLLSTRAPPRAEMQCHVASRVMRTTHSWTRWRTRSR